ncbi:hypothetical protein HDR61_00875 [bacterium]|nr:hypothetical protein [bacterium]
MASEREKFSPGNKFGSLILRRYDINGNVLRAFFDALGSLVFVVDDTVYADKPNSLLVINPVGNRKWDDILSNDYNIELEAVRPKKDNKYQKLDIEYSGLDNYDALIRDYDAGDDVAVALGNLVKFRRAASRRAAAERLAASDVIAENARGTIARANIAIDDAKTNLKTLRSKLALNKKSVGREPTKQSAAKILRTESQIDAQKEKLARAQRRLENARRRLVAAEDDADVARAILAKYDEMSDNGRAPSVPVVAANNTALASVKESLPATVSDNELPVPVMREDVVQDPAPDTEMPQFKDIIFEDFVDDTETPVVTPHVEHDASLITEQLEEGTPDMAEEDVKPLFDKDPEILDEEIAFKPIDFQAPSMATPPQRFDDVADVTPAPLSFTPPVGAASMASEDNVASEYSPVLDTLTPAAAPISPMPVTDQTAVSSPVSEMVRPAPVMPGVPGANAAPVAPTRPVAPQPVMPAAPVAPVGVAPSGGRKPNLLYYILLMALIVLSIFTLWLYQKNNGDTVPDLAATNNPVAEQQASQPEDNASSPFITVAEEIEEVVSQPDPEPVVEPEPEPVMPVIDETIPVTPVVPEPVQEIAEPEPDTPFLTEPEPEPEPEPIIAPIVNKPVYNAGAQNENMFVAADNYDTDTVAAPSVYEDTVVTATQYESADVTCEDGTVPDGNGCCTGEVYTDTGGNGMACCSAATGECYPPMF